MSRFFSTRQPRRDEIGYLRDIWSVVFADGDESSYFDYYFDPDMCIAAIVDEVPVAAGYLLPAGDIICSGISVPCAMIYGVATLPEYRSLGCGTAIVRDLLSAGRGAGFPAVTLCPSNDSLFGFYSERSELRDWFYINEQICKYTPASSNRVHPDEIPPQAYGHLRENLLANIPHIKANTRALLYQSMLCDEFGGGLFRIDTPGGVSCAVVEQERSGTLLIKELLAPGGYENYALSSIASAFPSNEYIVRSPARRSNMNFTANNSQSGEFSAQDFEQIKRFGMVSAPDILPNLQYMSGFMPWFGLAFD